MNHDLIFARRSIRRYSDRPVTGEQEQLLLEAAMAAPSAHDLQPWRFIVIRDRELLDRIAEVHPYGKMLRQATMCIAVLGDPRINGDYWIVDCAAATENILLAATALGLGSCWLGMHPRPERQAEIGPLLNIPDEIKILSLVAVGHPDEEKGSRTRFDPEKVRQERW